MTVRRYERHYEAPSSSGDADPFALSFFRYHMHMHDMSNQIMLSCKIGKRISCRLRAADQPSLSWLSLDSLMLPRFQVGKWEDEGTRPIGPELFLSV